MSKNITRKEALKRMGLLGLSPMLPSFMQFWPGSQPPNIIMVYAISFVQMPANAKGLG